MRMKRVVIAGGTGFIGSHLVQRLLPGDHAITILSRHPEKQRMTGTDNRIGIIGWNPDSPTGWQNVIDGADAVINLSGHNLASGRWTKKIRRSIIDSRVRSTAAIRDAVTNAVNPPKCVIQASAVGYYGTRTGMETRETSPAGNGFLADVVQAWENEAAPLNSMPGTRLVILRFGIVLGADGGLYRKTSCLVRHYLGAVIGSGENWMSWIHIDDLTGIIEMMLNGSELDGIFNAVAPSPVRSREYMSILAETWHRHLIPAPPVGILRLVLGAAVDELLLASQHIVPNRLLAGGYHFRYPDIRSALAVIHEVASGDSGDTCSKEIGLT